MAKPGYHKDQESEAYMVCIFHVAPEGTSAWCSEDQLDRGKWPGAFQSLSAHRFLSHSWPQKATHYPLMIATPAIILIDCQTVSSLPDFPQCRHPFFPQESREHITPTHRNAADPGKERGSHLLHERGYEWGFESQHQMFSTSDLNVNIQWKRCNGQEFNKLLEENWKSELEFLPLKSKIVSRNNLW